MVSYGLKAFLGRAESIKQGMETTLLSQRRFYNCKWYECMTGERIKMAVESGALPYDEELADLVSSVDVRGQMQGLIVEEGDEGRAFVEKSIHGYISLHGLEQEGDEIIDEINRAANHIKLCPSERALKENFPSDVHPLDLRNALNNDNFTLLRFGLDYVDRWKMYNQLFAKR